MSCLFRIRTAQFSLLLRCSMFTYPESVTPENSEKVRSQLLNLIFLGVASKVTTAFIMSTCLLGTGIKLNLLHIMHLKIIMFVIS